METSGKPGESQPWFSANRDLGPENIRWHFLANFGSLWHMDKGVHGPLLKAAMARKGYGRQVVADYVGVGERTVTNWTTAKTKPSDREQLKLRELLGPYDSDGDPVEVALANSGLADFRQSRVLSLYQELLHEQRRDDSRPAS